MQKVKSSISGKYGRRRVRWCSGKEDKYFCKFNNSWTEEFNLLSQSHVNNAHAFCKVCHTDFNIGHGGENEISQHIKSQRHISAAEAQQGNT